MVSQSEWELCLFYLRKLVAFQTVNPPGKERIAAEWIADELTAQGIECELSEVEPGRANVATKPRGSGPAVVFSGHLDVVPTGDGWQSPPFELAERNGRLYARGACDMKGGIAAMMAAAVHAHRAGSEVPFRLVLVADEEIYGKGTAAFLKETPAKDVRYVVLGEPTLNAIHIAHRGAIRFRITQQGKSCHAGNPKAGVNAIEHMATVIHAVELVNAELATRKHPVLPPPTMCCTMIDAGTKDNIVPDRCTLVVDCRPSIGDTPKSFAAQLSTKMIELGGDVKQTLIEPYIDVPAGGVETDSAIVQWATKHFEQAFDEKPDIEAFPACCDLSQFTASGCQTILYGPGSIAQAHTIDEFVTCDQLQKALVFYKHCMTVD